MPFTRWMEMAGGGLGWSEGQFWNASIPFFRAAMAGYYEKNGQKSDASSVSDDVAAQNYEDAKREYAAELSMSDEDLARLRNSRK